jgi:rSAM/selenodomain-associated transferase 2
VVSIIIPVYNEEASLLRNDGYYREAARAGELIFVDGGSTDGTVSLAEKRGRVISSPKNRAAQMNRGAAEARHDILLFLHADARIHLENLRRIISAVEVKKYVGGCFQQELDAPEILYRWIAWTGNLRARLSKVFYGDQAIFVRRDVFFRLGGFPEVKIGEDVLFTKKLRRAGRVGILPYTVRCSTRRWKSQGVRRTFWLNWRINAALIWNRDLDRLAEAYHDVREGPDSVTAA